MQNIFRPEKNKSTKNLELGGKAEGLFWLSKNGFDTPDWCVLPSQSVDAILGPEKNQIMSLLRTTNLENLNSKLDEIEVVLDCIEKDSSRLERICKFEVQQWITDKNVESSFFAVRSSLVGEDGTDFSFAGQLTTVLGVPATGLTAAIFKCLRGSFAKTVLTYKLQNNLDLNVHKMSVIIQKMVFADKSGVGFSINPNTSDDNEVYISATFGDCEGLVSGLSDCDTFIVQKDSGEVSKQITAKKIFSNLSQGKPEDALPEAKSKEAVLNKSDLETLSSEIKSIEQLKNQPQDIEWAMDKGRLYFLQVRPVTSKVTARAQTHKVVFDNSNIQESYCGVTLPLTFSLASECYRLAYNQLMSFMGFSDKDVEANDFRHSNMLSYVDGRVYYNIKSWYEGLKFMPSFGRSKEDMETMMGVQEPVDFVQDLSLSRSEKIAQLPKLLKIVFRLTINFAKIDRTVLNFDTGFWTSYKGFQRKLENKKMSSHDLIKLHKNVTDSFLKSWAAPLVNDFFVMVYNGKVKAALKKVGHEEALPILTSGEDLESIKPTLEIGSIAELVVAEKLTHVFINIDEKTWRTIRSTSNEIKEKLDSFMLLYGDRCIGELKLETETFRYDKKKLLKLIKNFIDLDESKRKGRSVTENESFTASVFDTIGAKQGALALYIFKRNLKKLRKGIRYRESMRLHRTRVVGLFRQIYREIGSRFCELDVINNKNDIFYLSHDEIQNFICGKSLFKNLKKVVDLRKNDFEAYHAKEPLHHFSASFPYSRDYKYFEDEGVEMSNEFKGLGCYPGLVEAPVELMINPDESVDLKGKILCTMRTDPGWAPLFPQVEGLLIERGSSLSHSAVVAREMGIPTVVGVEGITRKVKSGEFLSLDGAAGRVKRIDERSGV